MSSPEDYTIGWICAITEEYVAAQEFLDKRYEKVDVLPGDRNPYTLGRIGEHNVAITILPGYGTSSAASVAKSMQQSFRNIKYCLMVGISGGAPSGKHDIRLGDIVIGTPGFTPTGPHGGILQYDFGKEEQGLGFRLTKHLNQPHEDLLAARLDLEAKYVRDGQDLGKIVKDILRGKTNLREYQRPEPSSDRLYNPTFGHQNGAADCVRCDQSHLVHRGDRTTGCDNPVIHYGLVASGNRVMKNAGLRDELAKESGVLCFEMEAAGIANVISCLVIRGVCDYSDSHKSKGWQGYAAMVAAAYARDLLYRLRSGQATKGSKKVEAPPKPQKVKKWLQAPDHANNYNTARGQQLKGSGSWLLEGKYFDKWKKQRNSFLWLYGIPGCGKTILSSTIIGNLQGNTLTQRVIYFYFDSNKETMQTPENMVRSLINQLYSMCPETQPILNKVYTLNNRGDVQPPFESLFNALMNMIEQAKEVWIVLDALGECSRRKDSLKGLLSLIKELLHQEKGNIHLLATSRDEPEIRSGLEDITKQDNKLSIEDSVADDIRKYINWKLEQGDGFQTWRGNQKVHNDIKEKLMGKANGMFQWVACLLDSLEQCNSIIELENVLGSLPQSINETYNRILHEMSPPFRRDKAITLLQMLVFTEGTLRIDEAVDAIAIDLARKPPFLKDYRISSHAIARYCSTLVITHPELKIAHASIKEFLKSDQLAEEFSKHFQEKTARASLAKLCLSYLLQLDTSFSIAQIRTDFPFAKYCATHWMSHAAATEGNDGELEKLINKFFRSKHHEICLKLHRPDVDENTAPIKEDDLRVPLYYAALGGLEKAVECLLNQGDDVNAQGGYFGNALQAASVQGHTAVVKLLLGKGAKVNIQAGRQGTALFGASVLGHDEVVELLLRERADIDARNREGGTALHAASSNGHKELTALLLEKGADIELQDRKIGTALHAASRKGHQMVAKLLLDAGTDVNARGGTYNTALQAASYKGHQALVKLLLDREADVDAQGGKYGTALQAASYKGHQALVELLLDKGADVNAQCGGYGTALQAASYQGHQALVELLLDKRADVNAQCGGYGTAFYAASLNGHKEVSKLLLNRMAPELADQWRKVDENRLREISGLPSASGTTQPIHPRQEPSSPNGVVQSAHPQQKPSSPKPSSPPQISSDTGSLMGFKKPNLRGRLKKLQALGTLSTPSNPEKHGETGHNTLSANNGPQENSGPPESNSSPGYNESLEPLDTIFKFAVTPIPEDDDDVLYSDRAVNDRYFNDIGDEDNGEGEDEDDSETLCSDPDVYDVLNSDIGINTLLNRLKQSIASAKELASFCSARARVEAEREKSLRRVCKNAEGEIKKPECRQGSYMDAMFDIIRVYERMADHDNQFSKNVDHIHAELIKEVEYRENKRKHWKQVGADDERSVQDAEQKEKRAKTRYDNLAEEFIQAKKNSNISSRRFTLRGPMTAGQFEEDLYHKVTAANEEYRVKAVAAQQLREKFVSELRPAAVYELRLLTEELDDILKTKMEQLAIQQEMLIWNDEAVINPAMRGVAGTSLRGKIAQIDNNADFRSDILDLSGNVMRLLSRKQTR